VSSLRPFALALALLAGAAAGCSVLVDTTVSQCASDEDCALFGAWSRCDLELRLCVAAPAPPADAGAPVDLPLTSRDLAIASLTDVGHLDDTSPLAPDAPATDGGAAGVDAAGDAGAPTDLMEAAPLERDCHRTDKPLVRVEGDVTASDVLTCDKDYLLLGTVFVKAGVILTIEKGTTVRGDGPSKGTLVVQPGARLVAEGTAEQPIVFTSASEPAARAPGDWGGVILLGRAPVNLPNPSIEGITTGGEYGGPDENDSSGSLRYVRIEYSGVKLGPNNEVNGLTFGGVGRGTTVDHVQVRQTADDCFEFFGGTVNARYLVCQYNGDDGFDWDNGYRGKLQFLVLQQDPRVADETNGFEGDNDALGTTNGPRSEPTIYNATLCGKGVDVEREQYGMLLRRSTRGRIFNTIVVGFEAGLDVRDAPATEVDVRSCVFADNTAAAISYAEDGSNTSTQRNDDGGFDEVAWVHAPERNNSVAPPNLRSCFDATDLGALAPRAPLGASAATPPDDGFFDPSAAFIGAFRGPDDAWARGKWVVWSPR
jgi:hypothetical protein